MQAVMQTDGTCSNALCAVAVQGCIEGYWYAVNRLHAMRCTLDAEVRSDYAAQLCKQTLHLHSDACALVTSRLPSHLVELASGASNDTYVDRMIHHYASSRSFDRDLLAHAAARLRMPASVIRDRVVHYVDEVVPSACRRYVLSMANSAAVANEGVDVGPYAIDRPVTRASPVLLEAETVCALEDIRESAIKLLAMRR